MRARSSRPAARIFIEAAAAAMRTNSRWRRRSPGELGVEAERDDAGPGAPRPHGLRESRCTSTSPVDSTSGDRMKTPGKALAAETGRPRGPPRSCPPGGRTRCAARRCRAGPGRAGRPFRPRPRAPARSCLRRSPASAGLPSMAARSGSRSPTRSMQHRHRRALAARQDYAVETVEVLGGAHQPRPRAACFQGANVLGERALHREDPDERRFGARGPVARRERSYQPLAASSSSLGMAGISSPCIAFPSPAETSARISGLSK